MSSWCMRPYALCAVSIEAIMAAARIKNTPVYAWQLHAILTCSTNVCGRQIRLKLPLITGLESLHCTMVSDGTFSSLVQALTSLLCGKPISNSLRSLVSQCLAPRGVP